MRPLVEQVKVLLGQHARHRHRPLPQCRRGKLLACLGRRNGRISGRSRGRTGRPCPVKVENRAAQSGSMLGFARPLLDRCRSKSFPTGSVSRQRSSSATPEADADRDPSLDFRRGEVKPIRRRGDTGLWASPWNLGGRGSCRAETAVRWPAETRLGRSLALPRCPSSPSTFTRASPCHLPPRRDNGQSGRGMWPSNA